MSGPEGRADGASVLLEFIRYNNWANGVLLELALGLTAEQLDTAGSGAYGTIRETLTHIVRSEAGYARLLNGYRPQPELDWESNPGLAEIAAYAEPVGRDLLTAAERYVPGQMIHQTWEEGPVSYSALALMIQVVNHGVEHRTNVTTILSQLGVEAPDLAGWGYLWANFDRLGVPPPGWGNREH